MHPLMQHEIARYRQVDMLRESQRERLGRELSSAGEATTRRRFRLRRRERPVFNPALR